jgi:site-specific DNA-methyltransferase (adenine-specific)
MWIYASGFPKAQDIGKAIEKREGKKRNRPEMDRYEGSDEVIDGSFGSGHGKCKGCGKDIVAARILGQKQACDVEGCEWMEVYRPADNEWAGWKTALKPAHEPIVMARKPMKSSTIDNVLEHGVGALNIDATRIPTDEAIAEPKRGSAVFKQKPNPTGWNLHPSEYDSTYKSNEGGRFPSNVLGEIPDYQKYFYCPKVSRAERHTNGEAENNHPTVKPVELMKYLVKLVTPKDGTVLDPFNGSGSTGMACVELGYNYVGCELDPNYVEIANNRISAWEKRFDTPANKLFE